MKNRCIWFGIGICVWFMLSAGMLNAQDQKVAEDKEKEKFLKYDVDILDDKTKDLFDDFEKAFKEDLETLFDDIESGEDFAEPTVEPEMLPDEIADETFRHGVEIEAQDSVELEMKR